MTCALQVATLLRVEFDGVARTFDALDADLQRPITDVELAEFATRLQRNVVSQADLASKTMSALRRAESARELRA